ncbi:MFS transporter [Rhodococcus sp. NPDC056960]|uniref:MFS transporter n=1 Tax=Rhodococcus sp. NPDC056960 TaxID=3345982 RepID=UPI00362B8011
MLAILDLSKVNVALPSIEASLDGSPTELQLVVSGYALAFGIALVPSGRLGDMGSRKLMLLLGVALFSGASLIGALAPTPEILLIGRGLQGVGAGMLMPQSIGLIQQLFQGPARGRAFGVFGAAVGISTAFGPPLGGLLIAAGGPDNGWRWLFAMNIPLGIAILVLAWRILPSHQARDTSRRYSLDPVGIALIAVATVALLIPFVTTTGREGDNPARWLWLTLCVLALGAFVAWERRYEGRGKTPVINLGLLRVKSYRHGLIIVSSWFAGLPALLLLVTLFLQQGLGLSAMMAGLSSIPFALTSALSAWYAGRRVERYGRQLIIIGFGLALAGLIATIAVAEFVPRSIVPWAIVATLTLIGAGGGLVMSPNQTLTLSEVPVAQGGVAGSVTQLGQRVGTAVGVAVASSAFYAALNIDDVPTLETYEKAFGLGLLASAGFVVIALITALRAWSAHRGASRRQQTADTISEGIRV